MLPALWSRCWQLLVLQYRTGWQRLGQAVEEGVVVELLLQQEEPVHVIHEIACKCNVM